MSYFVLSVSSLNSRHDFFIILCIFAKISQTTVQKSFKSLKIFKSFLDDFPAAKKHTKKQELHIFNLLYLLILHTTSLVVKL